jgi:hypothetical protein
MKKIKQILICAVVAIIAFLQPIVALAGNIGSSKLATGTEELIKDATSWLLVVAPLVTVVAVIYYFIRKTVSDEMDHKKWDSRISTAIICCIGVVAASLIINVIVGYYK